MCKYYTFGQNLDKENITVLMHKLCKKFHNSSILFVLIMHEFKLAIIAQSFPAFALLVVVQRSITQLGATAAMQLLLMPNDSLLSLSTDAYQPSALSTTALGSISSDGIALIAALISRIKVSSHQSSTNLCCIIQIA